MKEHIIIFGLAETLEKLSQDGPQVKKLHFYVSDDFGSLDCFCPRLHDRPDVALFNILGDNLRDKFGIKVRG